jgi:hypothetical protein
VIERGPQAAVIVVLERDKTKGLQHAFGHLPHRGENFGHAMHWTGLRLKGNFDEVAAPKGMGQPEQAAGY